MTSINKKELSGLIQQAENEGKWLHCHYQDLWFSPEQLRKANAEGRFVWGIVNWTLRDPKQKLQEMDVTLKALLAERSNFSKQIETKSVKRAADKLKKGQE